MPYDFLNYLDKINTDQHIVYTVIRTIITYVYAVILIRIGNKRYQLRTPIDYILIVILGAVLGRTIYGGASLLSTLVASFVLVLLHWIFAVICFQSQRMGRIFKGTSVFIIKDNQLNWKTMKKYQITEHDLLEECRQQLNVNDLRLIKEAILERTGKISFILKKTKSITTK